MLARLRAWRASYLSTRLGVGIGALLLVQACGGDDAGCNGPFCVSPGAPEAAKLKMGSGDGQQGVPARQLPESIDVIVTDAEDRPVADVPVTFAVTQGGGQVSQATAQSDIQGHAFVTWVLGPEVGDQNVQVSASSSAGAPLQGSPLTVSAHAVRPPPARIVLSTGPSDVAQNGIPFGQQPVVQVLDGDDQPLPGVQVVVSIASGEGTLSGATTATSDPSGLAAYTDLAIAGAAGPRTLEFSITDAGLNVVSGNIQLSAGTLASLTAVPPLSYEGTVGSPVTPAPSVVVKDASGNPVPGVPVNFTVDRDASVSPTSVTTNEDGVAQVASWTLGSTAAVQYSLSAVIPGSALAPVVFSATARAGAAGRLQIVMQPSGTAQNGAALLTQPVIQVTDQNGNPSSQAGIPVTATISSGSGTLSGAQAQTDGSGRAMFSGLTITGKVGTFTIGFSARGLAGVTSGGIVLSAGPPARLAVASAPPAARSRFALTPQPVIQVQDASGNPVAQAGLSVIASLNSATNSLGGQATVVTDGNGAAIYTDLSVNGPPGPQTITFSNPELGSATLAVTLPIPTSIEVSKAPPPSAPVGSVLTPNPVIWLLKDAAGQILPDVPTTMTASNSGSVQGSLGSGEGGAVQAATWTLGTTAGDQTLQLVVNGTAVSNTVHIQATPGPAIALQLVSGNNQIDSTAQTQLDSLLVVRLTDQYGNGISGVTIQWRSCDGAGSYDDLTTTEGYSSATQDTGPAGTFCTRATAPGSSVDFAYTVTASGGTSTTMTATPTLGSTGAHAPPPRAPAQAFSRQEH